MKRLSSRLDGDSPKNVNAGLVQTGEHYGKTGVMLKLVCFVYLVDLVHLVNQTNKTDQINQITVFNCWRTFSASC